MEGWWLVSSEGPSCRYRFGSLESRGLVAGWRGGQIVAVAVSLGVAVMVLRGAPSLLGALGALAVVCAGVMVATWPLRGRTAEQWVPDMARFAWGVLASRDRRRSAAPGRGFRITGRDSAGADGSRGALHCIPARESRSDAPGRSGPFGRMKLLEAPPVVAGADHWGTRLGGSGAAPMGMVFDSLARTYTAVLSVHGSGFVLLGPGEKDQRVGGWAGILAALGREGSAVHRLQWVVRASPGDVSCLHGEADARAALPPDCPAARSYHSFIDEVGPTVQDNEVLLAVSISAAKSAAAVRSAGGGAKGAGELLAREMSRLRQRLADIEVSTSRPLPARDLASSIRQAFAARAEGRVLNAPGREGLDSEGSPAWPWPMALEERWTGLRADGTVHVTYWVAEWPRLEVGADFLAPLLVMTGARRSVAITMEPVSSLRAERQVEQSRTAGMADAELRRQGGFLATARRRREEEQLASREIELADGHGQFRFTGYVTVTVDDPAGRDPAGRDPAGLEDACSAVEQAAGRAGIDLRRCYGDQLPAFMRTLPLARGLA